MHVFVPLAVVVGIAACTTAAPTSGAQPNPPVWPASVNVFAPGDAGIQDKVNAAFATNGGHEPANHGVYTCTHSDQ
jgi:hypothetical protein